MCLYHVCAHMHTGQHVRVSVATPDEGEHHWQVVLQKPNVHYFLILGEEVAGGGVQIKNGNQQACQLGPVNEDLQDLK